MRQLQWQHKRSITYDFFEAFYIYLQQLYLAKNKANGNDNLDYRPIFSEIWWGDFSFFIIFHFLLKKGVTQS